MSSCDDQLHLLWCGTLLTTPFGINIKVNPGPVTINNAIIPWYLGTPFDFLLLKYHGVGTLADPYTAKPKVVSSRRRKLHWLVEWLIQRLHCMPAWPLKARWEVLFRRALQKSSCFTWSDWIVCAHFAESSLASCTHTRDIGAVQKVEGKCWVSGQNCTLRNTFLSVVVCWLRKPTDAPYSKRMWWAATA